MYQRAKECTNHYSHSEIELGDSAAVRLGAFLHLRRGLWTIKFLQLL